MRTIFGRLGAAIAWLWWLLDASRRALLNLLLLAVLLALGWYLLHRGPPLLQERTTLVVNLTGPIREQYAGSLRDNALQQIRGQPVAQMRLRDVLAGLDQAAADPKIERVLILVDDFAGAGLPTLREVAAAVERVKAKGKQVIAWGSGYDQRQYYLASHASEVWMHPMGGVQLSGVGGYRTYYKDAFDKLGVTAHVLRVGQYKNAGETFVANAPSKETLEADRLLYDGVWAGYTAGIERARKLPPGSVQQGIEHLPERLAAAGGNEAKLAVDSKLVDALKTRDELRATLIERGVKDGKSFRQVSFGTYLGTVTQPTGGDAVGVIVAEGSIVDGAAPGGVIGGLSTAELIRVAREDERIKAIVLRVDSPGGSAFGAELVRRELELTRAAGKPVVVSMGDVAASGGYWISLAADEVIADEATVTGSIGVIAMLPSAERALDKLGVHQGGYATSWLVGAYDLRRGLDPRYAKVIQANIDHVYADFTGKAAAARKTTPQQIDAVGQGRVWTGLQAKERGLVDRTGSYEDALQAARTRAKLKPDSRVLYLDRDPGKLEQLVALLGARIAAAVGTPPALPGAAEQLWRSVQQDWSMVADVADGHKPFTALTHCLCVAP
jgi:protease-4